MDLIDSKYVDVKLQDGKLVVEVPVAQVAASLIIDHVKPLAEKLKAKIPGDLGDSLIDGFIKELEEKVAELNGPKPAVEEVPAV